MNWTSRPLNVDFRLEITAVEAAVGRVTVYNLKIVFCSSDPLIRNPG